MKMKENKPEITVGETPCFRRDPIGGMKPAVKTLRGTDIQFESIFITAVCVANKFAL
jgi:hypothetical protein